MEEIYDINFEGFVSPDGIVYRLDGKCHNDVAKKIIRSNKERYYNDFKNKGYDFNDDDDYKQYLIDRGFIAIGISYVMHGIGIRRTEKINEIIKNFEERDIKKVYSVPIKGQDRINELRDFIANGNRFI